MSGHCRSLLNYQRNVKTQEETKVGVEQLKILAVYLLSKYNCFHINYQFSDIQYSHS